VNENNQAQKTFQRKTIIIKKNLQYRYMFLISISVFIAFIIMSLDMIWTVSKVVNEHPMMQPMLDEIFSMAPLFFVKVIMYLLIVLIVSAVISHKMAGPVYKFEKSCKIISDGDLSHRVYLRKGDHMVELQGSFNSMVDNFHKYAIEANKLKEKASAIDGLKEYCVEYEKKIKEIFPSFKI
jgi:nitrogen fixation/metabolism regulation signal transduction histidine kinase